MFARWMASCRTGTFTKGEEPRHVVQCNGLEVGMVRKEGGIPKQAPFAVVIGCSDARVPTEMLFGQGFNDLFVIRVAGNVLGDVCLGSIDFAVEALQESVKVLVVLGHSGCGAVTGAVDAYLRPLKYWSKTTTPALRSILQKIFVSVREGANALEASWGPEARHMPGFRDALIETAVALNAAQAAFALRQEMEAAGRWEIEVLYGVYNLFNHQVTMPNDPFAAPSERERAPGPCARRTPESSAPWPSRWPRSSSRTRRARSPSNRWKRRSWPSSCRSPASPTASTSNEAG